MKGFFRTYGRRDETALRDLGLSFSPAESFERIRRGDLVRPAFIHPRFFDPHRLETLFEEYAKLARADRRLGAELELMIYHHRFDFDPNETAWPWACAVKCDYDGIPIYLSYSSTSSQILRQPMTFEEKRTHLEETFAHVVRAFNLSLSFALAPESLTDRLLTAYGVDGRFSRRPMLFQDPPRTDGRFCYMYLFTQSENEFRLFSSPEFLRAKKKILELWSIKNYSSSSTGGPVLLPPAHVLRRRTAADEFQPDPENP